MEAYDVVTLDDEKVGKVVGESGRYLLVEHGTLRKSTHALPREFAHADDSEQQVRMTVAKEVFCSSPKVGDDFDEEAVARYYGLTAEPGPTAGSAEEQELRDGIEPAAQERAEIREGYQDASRPEESPALLGDRAAGAEERDPV